MSTLRVNTIQNQPGTGAPSIDGLAKAWVNFNGTGTVAIRASFNVTSITDNGTGDYTVNFTTAMVDANYTVSGIWGSATRDWGALITTGTYAASNLKIFSSTNAGAAVDLSVINISIFR
jgi:hypothetical protein